MAHLYAEKREQPVPGEQTRWICRQCHREWIYARVFDNSHRDMPWEDSQWKDVCPTCHSNEIEQITFTGIFDSTTDDAEVARLMSVTTEAQLQAEADRRIARPAIHDVSEPPAPLVAAARSWAPEFE